MNEIGMTELVNIVSNLGFPIMLTIYLLVRFEKKIENLETVIKDLEEIIKDVRRS
jgi:hypothetical protein